MREFQHSTPPVFHLFEATRPQSSAGCQILATYGLCIISPCGTCNGCCVAATAAYVDPAAPGGSAGRLSPGKLQANNGSRRDQLPIRSLGTMAALASFRSVKINVYSFHISPRMVGQSSR